MKTTMVVPALLLLFSVSSIAFSESNNQLTNEGNMDKYEQLFREKFIEVLELNGYPDGYDFSLSHVDVSRNNHYTVPRITGSLSYVGGTIYVPQGVQFESIYELTMILEKSGIEFSERDRGSALCYWAELAPESEADPQTERKVEYEPVRKGPYPGINYFQAELNALKESLEKFQPKIDINSRFNETFNLGDKTNGLMHKSPSIYQVSDDVVYMVFVYNPDSHVDFGFRIHYNIKSGEVLKTQALSPPSLI
jgi:hypothetical protein